MRKNVFKRETLNLTGGIIIPPFIIEDYYLEPEEKYHLAEFLQRHYILCGEITTSAFKSDSDNHYLWYRGMLNMLQDLYYIYVISEEELDDCLEFRIQINPWYLKYTKTNPYYGVYQMNYLQFLKTVILPEIEDTRLREELINTILDWSVEDDLDS